jgi:DNA modification methylase
MQLIAIKDLIVPENRQRKLFEGKSLEDLAESIRSKGLFHPPVLRDDDKTLMVGERRARAMAYLHSIHIPFECNGTRIPEGQIPYLRASDLNELQLMEAELEENLCRVNLTWQEETAAMAALTEVRRKQDPGWTPKDTAREVDGTDDEPSPKTYDKTRAAEILQKHLDDPDVLAAKTQKDALKVIKKKMRDKSNALLAELADNSPSRHKIIWGDMVSALKQMEDNTFSVILTDPPYGVDADKFGDQASEAHEYQDDLESALKLVEVLATEGYRVTREEAHAYVFCDIRYWPQFCTIFREAGWYVWATPLIWVKGNGMLPRPEHGPRRCYEAIMYAIKGDKKVNAVHPDVLLVGEVNKPNFGAEKPKELYKKLLMRSVLPGDQVLDTFAGAGPIIPAANTCNVTATTIELNEKKVNFTKTRLEETCEDLPQ